MSSLPARTAAGVGTERTRIRAARARAASGTLFLPRGDEQLAIAVGGHLRDQTGAFHVLDQARSAVVADAQVPLHERDGCAAVLEDDLHGLVVERIGFS